MRGGTDGGGEEEESGEVRKEDQRTVTSQIRSDVLHGLVSAPPTSDPFCLGAEPRMDASRLDLRVGRLLSVRPHPLSDGLSVQEVDVGENGPRTVVSKQGGGTHLDEVTTPPHLENI